MVSIALPMVVSLGCDTVMVFTDRLFLSRLSPELMNASMGGGLTVFMMSSFFLGLFGYVTALTAQYLGAGRKKDCAAVVTQAVWLSCLGYPMFLNMMAFNTLVMIFHAHNAVTATAATVVFNWDMVSFLPLIGLEVGVTSLVGRFMGAGRPETAQKSAMAGLKMGLIYSAFVVVLFVGFPGHLVGVFLPGPSNVRAEDSFGLAVWMVRLASLYVLVEAVLIVFIGTLRGAGDTVWAMGISVSVHWVTVGALYVILRVLKGSPEAGWTAVVVMFVLFSGLVYARYQNGKWKQMRVVQREPGWVPGGDVPEVF